jgi:hypothetical protein
MLWPLLVALAVPGPPPAVPRLVPTMAPWIQRSSAEVRVSIVRAARVVNGRSDAAGSESRGRIVVRADEGRGSVLELIEFP